MSVAPPSAKIIGTSKPTFTINELMRFRNLLEEKEFDTLNKKASMSQATFERDPSYEYQVHDFFFLFKTTSPEHERLLDAWVKHSPDHFAPYLMRAYYFYLQGWASRGRKYAAETTPEQFEGMHASFLKSRKDIDTALSLRPRLLTAHIMLLHMSKAGSKEAEKNRLIEQTFSLYPTSFLMCEAMLLSKLPRWGGSYREMNDIAMRAYKQIETNNEFFMLFGMIFAEQAWAFRMAKKYDKALALYTKAILYGEHYSFLQDRAKTYYFMNDYDKALEDVNRSISLRPAMARPYSLRAAIYSETDKIEKAKADFTLAKTLSPGDPETADWKDWVVRRCVYQGQLAANTNPNQALAAFDQALEIDPLSNEAIMMKGRIYTQLNQIDQAITEYKIAIRNDPRNFKAFKELDYALATQKRWDEIISYWNQFLAMEPDNAEAYLERAGSFHHKGDEQNARVDLKRACDLGQQQACSLLRKQGRQ
ncbi:MAG: tetratricopeptide repeat protein [Deltaproteobacteria bacterium]|nr:tetratricopeptide repeat protein [Deltaproteobacteria bacterium]